MNDTLPATAAVPDGTTRRRWLAAATAVVVVAIGVAAIVGSRDYPYWTDLGPGPGFFPRWLGALLVACGLLWLVQLVRTTRAIGVRRKSSPTTATATATPALETSTELVPPEDEAPEFSLPTVVAIVVSLCVLAATLEVVGYQLAMFVFLLFHLLVLGRRRLLLSLVIALVGSFGVFVVFTRFLTVPLPASSIPFLRDLGL